MHGVVKGWKGNPSSGALASVAPRALIPGLRARAPWCVAGGSGSPCRLGPLGASFSPAGGVAVPLFSAPLTPFLFTLGDSEGGFAPAGCFFRGGIEAWAGYGSGAPASVAPRGLFPGLRARAPGCGAGGSGSPSRLGPAPFSPRPVVWPARSLPRPFPPLPPFVRGFSGWLRPGLGLWFSRRHCGLGPFLGGGALLFFFRAVPRCCAVAAGVHCARCRVRVGFFS